MTSEETIGMASGECQRDKKFHFRELDKNSAALKDNELQRFADEVSKVLRKLLPDGEISRRQWCRVRSSDLERGMKGRMFVQNFSYDQLFQAYQKDDFILDFFQDPVILATLGTLSDSGSWGASGFSAERVEVLPVPCSVTSMTFFDRLEGEELVREGGRIVKCFDEFFEDFTISDEVRKMILLEESDNYEIYSEAEREQFLFRLFEHLCLGGSLCQYEDSITPYLDTTKLLYKDLVSVQKDPSTKELRVTSHVFKVKAWDKDNYQFYPCDQDHRQTFAYFIVDPLKRHVGILYHRFGSGIFT